MCGRYTLSSPPKTLTEWFDLVEAPLALTRYNIAPTQPVAVIPNDGPRMLHLMRWGLVPASARDPRIGNQLINARAETVAVKPAFRSALRRRRCVIPADGFYEWRRESDGTRTPILIRARDGHPLGFAGLWEEWIALDGAALRSCTIITTTPNTVMAAIHDRMPVILPRAAYACWLTAGECRPGELTPLLRPCPEDELVTHPVSRLVNNPRIDVVDCTTPLEILP